MRTELKLSKFKLLELILVNRLNQLMPHMSDNSPSSNQLKPQQLKPQQLKSQYDELGYFVVRDYFSAAEMAALREVILTFHNAWKSDNLEFYKEVAFNSSLITGSEYLTDDNRVKLFNFISCPKLMALIDAVIPINAAFMNTQLFFDPPNSELTDFWHRDCQYDHDIENQKKAITETQVMHLRVPLFDEPGMELIPETHRRWDTPEELDVRNEENGRLSNENLPNGTKIKLAAGDVLVFSADMIHRGIYGLDRLAFDILVFDSQSDFSDYVDDDCLPNAALLKEIDTPKIYLNTISAKKIK
jgi:ectoine hydroxylase-related dioxygenase (phytanoyl-CoA dioxygenase family)